MIQGAFTIEFYKLNLRIQLYLQYKNYIYFELYNKNITYPNLS